jgi:hypothetical protein
VGFLRRHLRRAAQQQRGFVLRRHRFGHRHAS